MVERFERFSYAIFDISRSWHKIATDVMEEYGLKGAHSVYLTALCRYPEGLTSPMLCKICGKDKADVSRAMNIMAAKGLVIKSGSNQNKYNGVFNLTELGIKVADTVRSKINLAVESGGGSLSANDREIFYSCLEVIAENLRQLSADGFPDND